MRITEWERARYWVTGSEPEPYLVDMLEYKRNGQCNCTHFRIRIQPRLEAGEKFSPSTCKHIDAVRRCIVRSILKAAGLKSSSLSKDSKQRIVNKLLFKLGVQEREFPKAYGKKSTMDPRISGADEQTAGEKHGGKPYFLRPEKAFTK